MNIYKISLFLVSCIVCMYWMAEAKCPERSQVQPFDLNQFSGNWYMVGGTPVNGKSLSKCGHFRVFGGSGDMFTMNYTAVNNRRNQPVAFIVTARVDDDITGNWQLQGSTRVLGPFKHRLISVDYNSYALLIVCGDTNQIIPTREFSMIWSRGKTLSPTLLNQLKRTLSEYIDNEDILDVDHTSC